MEMLEAYKIISLNTNCCDKFSGITFDGCFFYLTMPQECNIYKFDQNFNQIDYFNTNRSYVGICFDHTENCFWASEDKAYSNIYKLNHKFKEIDQLKVKKNFSPMKGLSYNCENNSLITACNDRIIEVSKDGDCICTLKDFSSGLYESVLSISPYHAVIWQDKSKQEIRFYNAKGYMIKNFCLPSGYNIEDILFYPYRENNDVVIEIMLLTSKYCSCPMILCCKITDCNIMPYSCNYEVNRPLCKDETKMKHHECENKKKLCKSRHPCDKECKKKPHGNKNPCDEEHKDDNPCEHDDIKKQCVWDLIESIALIETALSHILNTEGEKLQKAVKISNDINDLLEINKSINKTLTNTTFLENALYTKLDAMIDLCKKSKLDLLE